MCHVFICTLASAKGSKLNYGEAHWRKSPTEQRDNTVYECSAPGLLLRLKSQFHPFPGKVLYTWNTIIRLVIHRLRARKLPYFSGGRQVFFSGKSGYRVKWGPITSRQCECDRTAEDPRQQKVSR